MSMEITWLDFQLSTDNQNGRHLATNFFSSFFLRIPSKPGIYIGFWGLRVYWYCPFSCETENEAAAAIFNKSFLFLINCLETWHI